MAELAASIAHEVNQSLAAILASANALERWVAADNTERALQSARSIARDAAAAAEVIDRIRALFRGTQQVRRAVHVNTVIEDTVALMSGELRRSDIALETRLDPALRPIVADRVQIQQVIVNLLRNGVEAMDLTPRSQRQIGIKTTQAGDSQLRVDVWDRGTGITEAEKVFDPFFSTKRDGMGMGLAICRSVIESHVLSLVEFCRLIGISYAKVAMGVTDEIRRFFDIVGGDPTLAEKCQPRFVDGEKRFILSGDRVMQGRVLTKSVRFCPMCLLDDMAAAPGDAFLAPYGRLPWNLSGFRTCPKHGHKILDLPPVFIRHGADFHGTLKGHFPHLERMVRDAETRPSALEGYLRRRLLGEPRGRSIVDTIGINGLITMSEHLGNVVEYGPQSEIENLGEGALARAANAGFDILRGGPTSIRAALVALEPAQGNKPSITRTWGRFYFAAVSYRGKDIEPLNEVLREVLLERYPKKIGAVVLDRVVTRNTVTAHSFKSTAKHMGVSSDVMRKMSSRSQVGGLVEDRPGFVSAQEFDELTQTAKRLIHSTKVLAALGIRYSQYFQLRKLGLIRPVRGVSRFFDKVELDAFVNSFAESANVVGSPPPGTCSLPDIFGQASISRLISHVRRGDLTTVWFVESETGLRKVWLSEAEVATRFRRKSKAQML